MHGIKDFVNTNVVIGIQTHSLQFDTVPRGLFTKCDCDCNLFLTTNMLHGILSCCQNCTIWTLTLNYIRLGKNSSRSRIVWTALHHRQIGKFQSKRSVNDCSTILIPVLSFLKKGNEFTHPVSGQVFMYSCTEWCILPFSLAVHTDRAFCSKLLISCRSLWVNTPVGFTQLNTPRS